jgi:hypothetical protein
MSTTLEAANDAMRAAVKTRLEATPKDDPKMRGYKPPILAGCKPAEECAADLLSRAASCCEGQRMRGDGLLSETYAEWEPSLQENPAAGSREWLGALERLRALHHEKTAQYGGAEDAFENVTASAKCGVEPWRRALCDLSDCVVRMQKYAQGQPVDPTNALLDAANWALICLIKMEEEGR